MTAYKHLTRHDMKQDELVSWMTRAIVWAEENTTQVLVVLGGVVAVVVLAVGTFTWMGSRTQDAYAMLADVQKVVRTPLATDEGAGSRSFATKRERAQRTLDAADRMLESYSSGSAANWARYYRTLALLDLGKAEEAATAANELLQKAEGDTLLGGLAQMAAGEAEEARANLPAAVDHYAVAATYESSGFPPELALLNQARCLDALGRTQEAVDTYQKVLDLYPDSPLAARASRQLQALRGTASP